jgi:hypothetical protein
MFPVLDWITHQLSPAFCMGVMIRSLTSPHPPLAATWLVPPDPPSTYVVPVAQAVPVPSASVIPCCAAEISLSVQM